MLCMKYLKIKPLDQQSESIQDARMYIKNNLGEKYITNAPRIYSSNENAQGLW